MSVVVNQQDLAWVKAGEKLIETVKSHLEEEKVYLFLSAGSVVRLYSGFAQFIKTTDVNPDHLELFQVDERFQPKNPDDINAQLIGKTGLWDACQKKGISYNIIPQSRSVAQAAQTYNQILHTVFLPAAAKNYLIGVFGIGEDSHTAGLLPGYKKDWDIDQWVAGYQNDGPFRNRISITPKLIREFNEALVVAVGEKKRPVLERWKNEKNTDPDLFPASLLHKIPRLEIYSD